MVEVAEDEDFGEFEPVARRQFLFREMGFLELLTDIVFLGFESGLYSYATLEENDFFKQTLQLSYTSIKHIIQEYRPNELYTS